MIHKTILPYAQFLRESDLHALKTEMKRIAALPEDDQQAAWDTLDFAIMDRVLTMDECPDQTLEDSLLLVADKPAMAGRR
jgi:hypothetical protein